MYEHYPHSLACYITVVATCDNSTKQNLGVTPQNRVNSDYVLTVYTQSSAHYSQGRTPSLRWWI